MIWLLFAFFLVACGPVNVQDQVAVQPQGLQLIAGETLGQSLISQYDGLTGISIHIENESPGPQELALALFENVNSPESLRTAVVAIEPGASIDHDFLWDSVSHSAQEDFYIEFVLLGDGPVSFSRAPGDAYLDGALRVNGLPLDSQLAFQTSYNGIDLIWGLFKEALFWLLITLAGAVVFVLPGWAIATKVIPKGTRLGWPGDLALYAGLSLSLYPILILVTGLLKLNLGRIYAWGPPLLALIYLVWRTFTHPHTRLKTRIEPWWTGSHRWSDLAMGLLTLFICISRFYAVRDIPIPLWGDSYQHTLITQLFLENNGLFESWAPYADLTTFTYHFGFHSVTAVFAWISGLSAPLAVLWTGQILNILAVLTLYLLAARVTGSRWAGVIAVLIAGLLVPMPMTYLNWGRYTQLAGQAILPVAIYLAWNALEQKKMDWAAYIPSWLAIGALALSHYRVLIFGVLFFLVYLLLFTGRETWRQNLSRTFWIGFGSGLLFLPWFIRVFGGRVMQVLGAQLTTAPQSNSVWHQYNAVQFSELSFYLPVEIWVLLISSLGWALACRKKPMLLMGFWWGLIALAANPQWINLPGVGAISTFTVLIAAYIPASLLIGAAAGDFIEPWMDASPQKRSVSAPASAPTQRITVGRGGILFVLIISLGIYGTIRRQGDLDLELGTLVTRPDITAAEWIDATLPPASTFLVNQFFAFGDSVLVGSDAGWWLPLLSGRRTTLPPINYSWEVGPRPDYIAWVNDLPRQIEAEGLLSPDVKSVMEVRGITHVYIGQRQGRVNYNGSRVLDPADLLSDPDFNPVYHEDRVWIFEFKP